jgi:glycosyltransferase involved in cell wall biosynthesis
VDDGSPDKCPQICDEYAARDNRIITIHKENGGLSNARNVGTSNATGDYIYYLDSDDELPLDSISILVNKLDEFPNSEVIMGEFQSIPCTSNICFPTETSITDYIDDNNWIREHYYRFSKRMPSNAVNKLIKKSFLTENNLYFKKGIIHEDELWSFYLAKKLSKTAFVHKQTYIRYINPNTITTSTNLSKKIEAWGIILKEIFSNLDEPAWTNQFFTYSKLCMSFYSPKHNGELYDDIWKKIIHEGLKHKIYAISLLLLFYKKSFPILRGHGIGFLIWIVSKYLYRQHV